MVKHRCPIGGNASGPKFLFFFFQAEDGIRDYKVTGVQTCALPIFGDSALIGCGTYAESSIGGVSCTGDGEAVMRVVLARRALDDLKEADDPEYAARVAVDLLVEEGRGHGGLILLDWRGRMGWAHSTPLMPVALMSPAFAEPRVPF